MDGNNMQQAKEERIANEIEKKKISELIIPLQAQVEILEDMKKYDKIDCHERLSELYNELYRLRQRYFTL
jgi:hypothetical protein